jgi:copper(I)-binding protein
MSIGRRLFVLSLCLCLSTTALADQANQQASQIQASGAWIRILPGALPAGAYVQLQNHGAQPARLIGASSTSYAQVMLHRSNSSGGISTMDAVDALEIPAHGQAALAPGGYHMMLMQPTAPVHPGDTVTLRLKFADGSTLDTHFLARPASALDASEPAHAHPPPAP